MSKLHVRPTAATLLPSALITALIASLMAAGSVFVGVVPMALLSGPLNFVVAAGAAVVVGVGMATAWAHILRYSAHASTGGERGLAATMGTALYAIGACCSAWFTATILAGLIAVHVHQREFVDYVRAVYGQALENVRMDDRIPAQMGLGISNIGRTRQEEITVGQGKRPRGNGSVSRAYDQVSGSLQGAAGQFIETQKARYENLNAASEHISAAQRAITGNDEAAFQEHVAKALEAIQNADQAALRVDGIADGLNIPKAEGAQQVMATLNKVAEQNRKSRHVLKIVSFEPLDARAAILAHPQPLGWGVALAIEGLPWLLMCILLAVWKEPAPGLAPRALLPAE